MVLSQQTYATYNLSLENGNHSICEKSLSATRPDAKYSCEVRFFLAFHSADAGVSCGLCPAVFLRCMFKTANVPPML